MEKSIDIKYANAFSEVLSILCYISKEDYEKIPYDIIEMMEDNCNLNYNVEYKPNIDINNQEISDEAKTIIAILYRDYWATEEQREKILEYEKQDIYTLDNKKREIYNPDNIFKNKNDTENLQKNNIEEKALVELKDSFFIRFKKFIIKILHLEK